jgi:two-component system sensor histidine kinase HydH
MEAIRPATTLLCAVVALSIGAASILRRRSQVHVLFAGFSGSIGLWYASQTFSVVFAEAVWDRVTGVLTALFPHFALRIFDEVVPPPDGRKRSRLTEIATASILPMVALELSPYQQSPWALGALYAYLVALVSAGLVSFARRGEASPSRALRERVRFTAFTGMLAMLFTLADFLSFVGVHLPPIGAALSTVFLFMLSESLVRERVADLYDLAVRLVVATLLATALALVFYLFVAVLGRFNTMGLNATLVAIAFVLLFEPLKAEVERRANAVFFRERTVLQGAVDEVRVRLAHVFDAESMGATVSEVLLGSRRVTALCIYLRDGEGSDFDVLVSDGVKMPERLDELAMAPLLQRLASGSGVDLATLDPAKPADHALGVAADLLGPLRTGLWLPIRPTADEIVGLLGVLDDRMPVPFTPEDRALLGTVASHCGSTVLSTRAYRALKERDRLVALGELAAGLAHEVKNPIGAIKGAAQLLEDVALDSAPAAHEANPGGADASADAAPNEGPVYVGIILEEVARLDRVVSSFLDYARPNAGTPIAVDVNAAVRRTMQILSAQGFGQTDVQVHYADTLPSVLIDPEKLRQVLVNLVLNALQAVGAGGKVQVTTLRRDEYGSRVPLSRSRSGPISVGAAIAGEGWVEIAVRDDGPGISKKVLESLFIPFFTTKEKGTGLGLAISQSIVQAAGGIIDVVSHPGSGSTFRVLLPGAPHASKTPLPPKLAL